MILIDNYDSFTWNLVQLIEATTGRQVEVVRNDAFDIDALLASRPEAIVISPGPGTPSKAGRIVDLIRADRSIPLLGVCLGHQAIGEAFGARVVRGRVPVHGKVSPIRHAGMRLFAGCADPLHATRYHSLVIERRSLPPELIVDAWTDDGEVMAVSHSTLPIYGIQFHPESYATPAGEQLIRNFCSAGSLTCAPSRAQAGEPAPTKEPRAQAGEPALDREAAQ
jgi:anthranilate synthase/aminodeoxychorismate synthase-like glutamine amidotransferase